MKKIVLLLLLATGAYAQTEVKFTAKIDNRNSDSIVFRGASKFRKAIQIDKKGIFTGTFAAPAGFYQMGDGAEVTMLYLKPGFDLSLTMDAKQFDESIVYKGKGEKENNFLAQKALVDENFENNMATISDEKGFDAAFAERSKRLETMLNVEGIDADFKALVQKSMKQEDAGMAAQFKQAMATQKLTGNASPTFDYENAKGGKTKLEDLRGKYVYIDVWATWCGPCRAEIPFLQKVEEKYKGKKIEFVSISVDEMKDHEKWKKMVAEKNLGGIQVFADNNWASAFIAAYGINSIPRFILLDPKGNVVNADAERPSDPKLQTILDGLLK